MTIILGASTTVLANGYSDDVDFENADTYVMCEMKIDGEIYGQFECIHTPSMIGSFITYTPDAQDDLTLFLYHGDDVNYPIGVNDLSNEESLFIGNYAVSAYDTNCLIDETQRYEICLYGDLNYRLW